MRREFLITLIAAGAMVFGVSGALAASPGDIAADLADNGCLDNTYTQAELDAYAQSATVQGYAPTTIVLAQCPPPAAPTVTTAVTPPVVTPPVVTPPVVTPPVTPPVVVTPVTPPASGVAGEQKTITKAQPKPQSKPQARPQQPVAQVAGAQTPPVAQTASAGTLPFTGSELGIFALVGAALLAGGIVLRASSRGR